MNRHRKFDLLERITQAVYDDGWNLLYISDPKYFPFRIRIYNDSESYNLRIYIWHLTHGGGKARPKDEYRVQITGVNHFEQEPNGTTLILGWWDEGGVFAGFDFRKHTGTLGASPSIQIREEALRKAYVNGIAPWTKENDEIAVSFRADFLVEYIRNLESLHTFGESQHDLNVLQNAVVEPNTVNDEVLSGVAAKRQTALSNVVRKVRDNSFKARVLTAYGNKCAFCGLQMKLVDAAHIVPVSYPESTDETRNGFSLCALHHRAYDKALVTINNSYKVVCDDSKMDKLKELHLDGGMPKFLSALRPIIILPPAISDRPHLEYDLKPQKKNLDWFHFGAFSYPILLEACGYLWPCIHDRGRYYCVRGIDKRFDGDYPPILSNSGFKITATEAKIMARCARNYVAIQKSLPDENRGDGFESQSTFKKEDVAAALLRGLTGADNKPWPRYPPPLIPSV